MAHVISEPCVGVKDHACVEVCPAACIYDVGDQLVINPDECTDCGLCVAACPVGAIFPAEEVPVELRAAVAKNAQAFLSHDGGPPRAWPRELHEELGETALSWLTPAE